MDVGALTDELEIPQRWYEAVVSMLAHRMSMELPGVAVDRIGYLEKMADKFLYDAEQDAYLIGRDHMGIIPLYTGRDEHGNFYVASEMKALVPVCVSLAEARACKPSLLMISTSATGMFKRP